MDHGFLLHQDDATAIGAIKGFLDGKQKLFLMPTNPTAENIAAYILQLGNELLADKGVKVVKVLVWETSNCYAAERLELLHQALEGEGSDLAMAKSF